MYFLAQGGICVVSTVAVAAVSARPAAVRVARRVPRFVWLYATLAAGPWFGLQWYLDKLTTCGCENPLPAESLSKYFFGFRTRCTTQSIGL